MVAMRSFSMSSAVMPGNLSDDRAMASTMARTGSAKTTELMPSGTAGPGNAIFFTYFR